MIESISIGKELELTDEAENFIIQPYDHVYIRTTPEFELQKMVTVQGEVIYPAITPCC